MRILLNDTAEKLERFSKATNIYFGNFSSDNLDNAVAVVIPDDNFKINIDKALLLDIPVMVIAGFEGSENDTYALKAGVPADAIIVQKDEIIKSLGGKEFAKGFGIKLKEMVSICQFILEQEIRPDIYVWKPSDSINLKQKVSKIKNTPETNIANTGKEQTSTNIKVRQIEVDFPEFIKKHSKIIVLLKATENAKSSVFAKKLSIGLTGFHLELSEVTSAYLEYTDDVNNALLLNNYGYCTDGQKVAIASNYAQYDTLILEINPTDIILGSLSNEFFDSVNQIYHVVNDFKLGKNAINAWLDIKLPLDGIIAEEENELFLKEYGDMVKSLEQVIKTVRS